MKTQRIQKLLAQAGVGSRRQIEQWIEDGRITVDGKPAQAGQPVISQQRFTLDGRPLRLQLASSSRVIILNKPEGVICTRDDPQGRPTVFEYLPRARRERWVLVGRLDANTSGLLLVTNNGELANRLMHPSSEIEREYAVRVLGQATAEQLQKLTEGVQLDDGPAHFKELVEAGGTGSNRWYHVVLQEGRNREVRRMWQAVGLTVSRLIRVRYANIRLPRIPQGQWRELAPHEVDKLLVTVGLQPAANRPASRSRKSPGKANDNRPERKRHGYDKGRKTSRQPARRRSRG